MFEILKQIDYTPFYLTLKLAFTTTVILFIFGLPLAYLLSFSKIRLKSFIEALVALPLVLPPSVLGFYLLLIMSKNGFLGRLWEKSFGHQLAFHFEGVVIASVIFSFPFMVHPLLSGFKSINKSLIEASYTLGKSKINTLFRVILPNMKPAILTGLVLSFAHTIGEFGVVLMVGGSIDGETKVVSIAIYDAVEKIDYTTAHVYAAILFAISFFTLLVVYMFNKRFETGM
ncbi:molybdate ABC transporter permease subunit [Calditerrivibrio nitroreducens]|uniref:Molybdenum transport system permease n=1 Tax=Calditerrivibrio nitroreducens (strain DSM 19672 / NBRC 101217 / Yu37-1) TaxID=768670 RepID=E4TES3_CALNY|nr:molybdate ABC transporter permease subunit [Calditerrivibrio nitroreducens]ADR19430.1 molybdate ABC transporter, inner membrane subunit [Calditerrivibrio nitroreducens DSM 19672]